MKVSKNYLNLKNGRTKDEIKILKQTMEFILGVTKTGLDIIDSEFNIRYIDPEWTKIYGESEGKKCYKYFMNRNEPCPNCGIVKALKAKKTAVTEEILVKEKNRPIQVTTIPFQNEKGEWLVAEVNVDISERKRAEKALRKSYAELEKKVQKRTVELIRTNNSLQQEITEHKRSEVALLKEKQKFQILSENVPFGIATIDKDGSFKYINPNFKELFGYDLSDVPDGRTWFKKAYPETAYRHHVIETWMDDLKSNKPGEKRPRIFTVTCKDETKKIISFIPVQLETGEDLVSCEDITERIRAEESLRESEERYRTIVENIEEGYFEVDISGNFTFFNDALAQILGYPKNELMNLNNRYYTDEKNAIKVYQTFNKVYRTGIPDRGFDWELIRKDGTKRFVEVSVSLIKDVKGQPCGFRGIAHDITERKQAEEALHRRDVILEAVSFAAEQFLKGPPWERNIQLVLERLGRAAKVSRVYIFENHLGNGEMLLTSQRYEWVVQNIATQIDNPTLQYFPYQAAGFTRWVESLSRGDPIYGYLREFPESERKILSPKEILSILIVPIFVGKKWWGFIGFDECSTERDWSIVEIEAVKTAASMLGSAIQRENAEEELAILEEQLRQSQKMEAIGRLAGGIAHDFNNLLTIIKGYSQLSLMEVKEDDPLKGQLEEVNNASDRASDLIRQLLAFSRRQVMDMKVFDLNTLLRNLNKMLCRIIGEDIKLITLLSDDLGKIKTDPRQIENAIFNLTVNARDAMPRGGKLIIETANVELDEVYTHSHLGVKPGNYVMLSVSDTGVGMTLEVKERAFEPFFTTKEIGQGTGLGLSTVYGIVNQSGGHIDFHSEPGHGTTFKIYFPRMDQTLMVERKKALIEELPRGHETVLVVEDEDAVRRVAVEILRRQGYNVIEASTGDAAILISEQHKGPIHLLVTDVVMPGMNGWELSKRLDSLHPETKFLHISGYTEIMDPYKRMLKKEISFLQKPFSPDDFVRKVREILNE